MSLELARVSVFCYLCEHLVKQLLLHETTLREAIFTKWVIRLVDPLPHLWSTQLKNNVLPRGLPTLREASVFCWKIICVLKVLAFKIRLTRRATELCGQWVLIICPLST